MNDRLERVKYRKSALREVIFQVNFPSILKIDADAPVEFQELVRQQYPLYNDRRNETVVNVNGRQQTVSKNHNHEFISADGKSKVNLTNCFVALSTLDYDRWEVFTELCKTIVGHLMIVYQPTVVQRIGLRYKDLITRSQWDLLDTPWNDLIKKEALGIVGELPENKINRYVMDFEILGEDQVIEHRHFELVRDAQSRVLTEKSFLIDCDYYYQGIIPPDAVQSIANNLHNHSSNFIRSIIKDALDSAMDPERI